MVLESNRDLVMRRLLECLGRDRTKHQVAEVTSLGLVQMTRKRVGQGLLEAFSETCEHCNGRGVHRPHGAGGPHGHGHGSEDADRDGRNQQAKGGGSRTSPVPTAARAVRGGARAAAAGAAAQVNGHVDRRQHRPADDVDGVPEEFEDFAAASRRPRAGHRDQGGPGRR